MSDTPTLVRKVRRAFDDRPDFVWQSGAVDASTNPITITLQSGQGQKFPRTGRSVEWDDGTGETATVTDLPAVDQITVFRADFGEPFATHADKSRILVDPRFRYLRVTDILTDIIDDLWPQIWVPKETTLTWQGASEYYSPTVTDVAELSYAYQLSGGFKWPIQAQFFPPTLMDDTNFPNGAIVIPYGSYADSSTIYVAYKAIPTTTNLLTRQEALVVEGAVALLTLFEEAKHVSPSKSAVEQRVADGSKLRAGAMLWQQFQDRLQKERARLLTDQVQGGKVWLR